MATFTEGPRTGGYIADEPSINLARRVVRIATGQGVLVPGQVLAKLTSSGEYVKLNPDADTGAQVARAILYEGVDATSAAVDAVVTFALTAVNEAELVWPNGISAQQKAAAVSALSGHHIEVLSATPALPEFGATTLVFGDLPDTAEKGAEIGPVIVRIENDEGQLILGDNTTSVALTKSSGPGTVTVTTPVTAVNGIATFTSVKFSDEGTVKLTAAAAGLTSAVSGDIVITDPA